MSRAAVATVAALLVATAAAIAGCTTGQSSAHGTSAPLAASSKMPMQSSTAATSGVQVCAQCSGKGKPARVSGSARLENGTQVVAIALKNGTYVPNAITLKAGMPVEVVFSGKAKGCLAKPKFASLGKSADVTGGTARLELGTLKKGTYTFTCAMGMNAGTIVAR